MWLFYVLLSTFAWAIINVVDSAIVHNHEKKPMALMWSQSMISLPILGMLAFILPLETSWMWVLILFGIIGYAGDVWFFHVLAHVDVSVTNIAWSILSLLLAASGFLLFGESWGLHQTIGALLIIGGALTLSFYHHRVNVLRMLWLVFTLAALFLPFYLMKKWALHEGQHPLTVFFWLLFGREVFSFCIGGSFAGTRRIAITAMRESWHFMVMNFVVILAFFTAEFTGTLAYATGPLSLVAIVSNIQPFLVMGIAGLLFFFVPSKAAKELLTRQSIQLKVICFFIVFAGLALLAIPK